MNDSDDRFADIEAAYRRSSFVDDIVVFRLGGTGADDGALHAVVVPDLASAKRRRIVNIGELLRFELEGQSIHLPEDRRIRAYDIWFEPIPRSASGAVDRAALARAVRQRRDDRAIDAIPAFARAGEDPDAVTAAVLDAIRRRRRRGALRPDANLEVDLGLDSMDRTELIAELEQLLQARLAPDRLHEVLTVSDLLEAIPRDVEINEVAAADAWTMLLRDLPSASDPRLRPILRRYSVSTAILFVLFRVLRWMMLKVEVSGIEHLPRRGPYIICPNHQSYLDPFVVSSTLPFGIFDQLFVVGATEYFESPVTAWLAKRCKLLPVDPDVHLVFAMRAAAVGLRHGRILVLFPEGERSIDGTVKVFKKGAAVLSRHLRAPIVPVAVCGMFEVWPRNRQFNWRALRLWRRHRVRVVFGPPMHLPSDASIGAATQFLQQRVAAMWSECQGARSGCDTR